MSDLGLLTFGLGHTMACAKLCRAKHQAAEISLLSPEISFFMVKNRENWSVTVGFV
jgi:hypothetical protein